MPDANFHTGTEAKHPPSWQRLHILSLVPFILGFFSRLAQHGFQAFAGAAALITLGQGKQLFPIVVGMVLLIGIIDSIVSYLTFYWQEDSDKLKVKSGLFRRKLISLSFDRIQFTSLEKPFYFKPFGLVNLRAESAGSSDEEIVLRGMSVDTAKSLRSRILTQQAKRKTSAPSQQAHATNNAQTTNNLYQATLPDLIKYALTGHGILIMVGLFISFFGSQVKVVEDITKDVILHSMGLAESETPMMVFAIYAGYIIIGIVLLSLLSIGATILRYHGYQLIKHGDRIERRAGLLKVTEDGLKNSKLQAIAIQRPIAAKLLSVGHFNLIQAGWNHTGNQLQNGFIIPSVTDNNTSQLCQQLMKKAPEMPRTFHRISWRYLIRRSVMASLLLFVITGALWLWGYREQPLILLGLLPFPIMMLTSLLRYRKYGYHTAQGHMFTRSGLLGESITLFPLYKAQHVSISSSPHERRNQLVSLTIALAGKRIHIPYMAKNEAEHIARTILHAVRSNRKPWM